MGVTDGHHAGMRSRSILASSRWSVARFAAVPGAMLAMAVGVAGCRSSTEVFDGKPTDQVWTAMVKAAEQPEYHDWHVIENDVWADEKSGRIEVWRLLRRYKDPPGQWSRLEDQEWSFAILLTPAEGDEPAEASFDVRSMCVPSHSWMEGERYFNQVWTFLGGRPTLGGATKSESTATPAAAPQPAPAPTPSPAPASAPAPTPDQAPPVDLPE